MNVSYDPDIGATYVEWADGAVERTVSVSDLVMVDVDREGAPVGVEFAVAPNRITDVMVSLLTDAFPVLKEKGHREDWLYTSA